MRIRVTLEGVVQGVGFRPFVYRLATSLNLKGYTLNSREGVVIEVEGKKEQIKKFLFQLEKSAPPLANITRRKIIHLSPQGYKKFLVKESQNKERGNLLIAPDVSICSVCQKEVLAPSNRRYQYPFINCTDCGPRFTIIKNLPYDREKTTMQKFKMCSFCQEEYEEPTNRRYHAQPNGCEKCGPEVTLVKSPGFIVHTKGKVAIKETIKLLKEGEIVAIKGLGGFHLICDATNEKAVKRLRRRKKRPSKPLALMALDVKSIRKFCVVKQGEENLLKSPQRPILLLRKLSGSPLASSIAPKNNYLGVMLPYTPLHYLVLKSNLLAIIATSGNLRDEPMVIENEEAIKKLSSITSHFLLHNRDIYNRCDDSILEIRGKGESFIRRARGYVPLPIELPFELKEILATGAELKNTFCLTRGNLAFLSQHIGDLKDYESLKFYEEAIERFKKLFEIKPKIIAYDLHPDYFSTRYAFDHSSNCRAIGIQHHYAHIASCMAENGIKEKEKVIGVAFDGTGYGNDKRIWGGEFFVCNYHDFKRIAHLKYLPLPGGDKAIEEPYRMAISYLFFSFGNDFPEIEFTKRWRKKIPLVLSMIKQKVNSPLTSRMGRFFDAVSSILGIRNFSTYEGQAAMELQAEAERAQRLNLKGYNYKMERNKDIYIIEPELIIRGIVKDLENEVSKTSVALKFHYTIAQIIESVCQEIREKTEINKVCLSGGVFQNGLLTELTGRGLEKGGFKLYLQRKVPANDGGICLGQAVIANFQK